MPLGAVHPNNTRFKSLGWSFEAERLARASVKLSRDFVQLLVRADAEES